MVTVEVIIDGTGVWAILVTDQSTVAEALYDETGGQVHPILQVWAIKFKSSHLNFSRARDKLFRVVLTVFM